MKSLYLRWVCVLFVLSSCALSGCAAERFVEVKGETISVDELFSRIQTASSAEFQNAVGYYVVRNYSKREEKKVMQELENLRSLLEETLEGRIENDKKFGVTMSEEEIRQMRESNLQTLEDREKEIRNPYTTQVERDTIEGNNYRIERIDVSDTDSLEKIRHDVQAGLIDFSHPNVITWNGKITAEINIADEEADSDMNNVPVDTPSAYSCIMYEELASLPDFMDHGRDFKDAAFLEQFRKLGLPMSASSMTLDGEQGLLLRIGDKSSVTFLMETCVLPSKGYVVAYGSVKTAGTTILEEEHKDFVKVNDGSWLPTRTTRTAYKLDMRGVPYVSSKTEKLAIEPPRLNVKLDKDTFDLANTEEFQSLPPLFAAPLAEREGLPKRTWFVMRWNLAIAGLILMFWALFRMWRRHRYSALGFFIAALWLPALSGCQHSDATATPAKYDVVLTDSGVVINHPFGVIPIDLFLNLGEIYPFYPKRCFR